MNEIKPWEAETVTTKPITEKANEFNPDYVSHPGETLGELMREKGITVQVLANTIECTPEEIEAILLNKASIGQITASELEGPLGVPASFWFERQRRYGESRAKRIDSKRL